MKYRGRHRMNVFDRTINAIDRFGDRNAFCTMVAGYFLVLAPAWFVVVAAGIICLIKYIIAHA